jgi:hypothetical protein
LTCVVWGVELVLLGALISHDMCHDKRSVQTVLPALLADDWALFAQC